MTISGQHKKLADDIATHGPIIPWWLSMILAGVAFIAFRTVVIADASAAGAPSTGLTADLAAIAQYLVPALLLFGGIVSFARSLATRGR